MRCSGVRLLILLISFWAYNAGAFLVCKYSSRIAGSDVESSEVGYPGNLLIMSCCVGDNYTVLWSRRDGHGGQWTPVNDDGGINFLMAERNQSLTKTLVPSDNGSQYRCDVVGTNRTYIKTLEVKECDDCCLLGQIIKPEVDVTIESIPIGSNVTFNCTVDIDCTLTTKTLTWYVQWFRRLNTSDDDVNILELPAQNYILEYKANLPRVESSLTVVLVNQSDFQYQYVCNSGDGERIFKLTVLDPPAPGLILILLPIFLPLGVALALVIVYVTRYDLRLLLHSCTTEDSPGASEVFVINSESQKDASFIRCILMPKLEESLGFKLVVNFRDFYVSNYEQQYCDHLRTCSRVLVLLSPSFLADDVCNKAFQMAYTVLHERHKIIFIVLSDLDERWVPEHALLRQCLRAAGRFYSPNKRLVWKPDFITDSVDGSQRELFWRAKRWKINRESAIFWKKLRLALPNINRPSVNGRRHPATWEMTSCMSPSAGDFSRLDSVQSDVSPSAGDFSRLDSVQSDVAPDV